jgi:hypothetical protein
MTDHDAVQEAAPELALGLVSGPERAAALAHLESCASCRAAVEELADVADALLLLAPETEPPPGFETRVLARADGVSPPRRGRRVLALAAVVAFLLGALAGGLLARQRQGSRLDREYIAALRELDGRALAAATLHDEAGHRTGQLFLYEGKTSWLFATVADPGASADLVVELRFEDGRVTRVPGLVVRDGRGSLGATVELRLWDLERISVVDEDGTLRYRAERAG